ncbi:MAG: cytidine deaminase, partial [Clostridia bacterium]|nr:cytidine deaminase [Clostridia bacterium]
CAKAIIQCGIKEVVYLSDKYADTPATKASKRMLAAAGVTTRRFGTDRKSITLHFD